MLFVVRRLQELGRARKISLYVYFIDLHKTYDTVDRQLLWVVLARFGVPVKMLTALRQFHEGRRVCDGATRFLCRATFLAVGEKEVARVSIRRRRD